MRLRGYLNRPAASQTVAARIFVGPDGLRSGWRVAIFLVLVSAQMAVILACVVFTLHAIRWKGSYPPSPITPAFTVLNELVLLPPVLGATAIMAWLEDTPLLAYGLSGHQKLPYALAGFAGGIAALSLLILLLAVSGYGFASRGILNAIQALRFGAEWGAVSLFIAITEEFAFRGYLLKTLARGAGFWPAALLTSLLFAAVHGQNTGETDIGLLHVFGAGLLLCLAIYFTKSLWLAIGFHAGWDYAENFVYGTHDSGAICYGTMMNFLPRGNIYLSGGLTGPEGSLFSFPVLLLAAATLWWTLSRKT